MELIVHCVRSSDNSETHHHTLLVMNVAIELYLVSTMVQKVVVIYKRRPTVLMVYGTLITFVTIQIF